MDDTFDLLANLFGFWPLIFIAALTGALKGRGALTKVMKSGLAGMLVLWGFFALLRLYCFATDKMVVGFLISEPGSTTLFFFTGFMLSITLAGLRLVTGKKAAKSIKRVNSLEDLQSVSPEHFEEMVAEYFRMQGHQAEIMASPAGDHGVDVLVKTKNRRKWVVQCKRYRKNVGEPAVRDLMGVIQHEEADLGILMTTGGFTKNALDWARDKPIRLVDGKQLHKLLFTIRRRRTASGKQPVAQAETQDLSASSGSARADIPICPRCGLPMILRISRRGPNAGQKFFGCPNYPHCKETIPFEESHKS